MATVPAPAACIPPVGKFANKIGEQLPEEWQRLQAGSRNSGATEILEQDLK